jgi:hypothetical protein
MRSLTGSAHFKRAVERTVDVPPPAGRPSLHFIEGEALLLDPCRQRLYRLNVASTLVWCLLEEGESRNAIERRLTFDHGLSANAAARLFDEVLRQWGADPCTTPSALPPDSVFAPSLPAELTEHYALRDARFRVSFSSSRLRDALHPLLLEWAARPSGCGVDVAVIEAGEGVNIAAAGRLIGGAPSVAAAAVALRAALTQLAVERSGGLCAVHAGSLMIGDGALLLPGNAGSGKSTLLAGLAASGLEMLSDDTSLLVGDSLRAASLPTGLCVKPGGYHVLASRFRNLADLPEWSRPDGLVAKYLRPGLDLAWAAPDSVVPVRWMIFPQYHPAHQTQLVSLARARALERLLPGIYFLSGTLDAANLDTLISWIEGVDCYELPLSSLEAAVAEVRRLCH